MILLRSILFNLAFYVVSALYVVVGSPLLLGPRSWAMAGLEAHGRTCIWLMRWIVGTRLEVRGRDKLPAGAALIASKHQSAWDTFGLVLRPLGPWVIKLLAALHSAAGTFHSSAAACTSSMRAAAPPLRT